MQQSQRRRGLAALPGANLQYLKQARWRPDIFGKLDDAISGMVKPFTLESMYPRRELELPRGSGNWEYMQGLLPHQQVFHDAIPPSERAKAAADPTYTPKKAKFVLHSGGVGCFSGGTIIEGVPAGDLDHAGTVETLFGTTHSSPVYRKGSADLWTVTLRSGRSIVVTGHHRFLTLSGWRRLETLDVGDLIAADGNARDNSHWGIPKGSRQSCSPYSRPCGVLPSPVDAAYREVPDRSFGLGIVRPYRRPYPSTDGSWNLSVPNLQRGAIGYRDGLDGDEPLPGQRLTTLLSEWLTHLSDSVRLCLASGVSEEDSFRLRLQFRTLYEGCKRPQDAIGQVRQRLSVLFRGVGMPQGIVQGSLYDSSYPSLRSIRLLLEWLIQFPERFLTLVRQLSESLTAGRLREQFQNRVSCDTSDYYDTSFWDEIQDIQYNSFGDFYDLTVPGAEHYSAEGIFNHNSGKSVGACVDLVYHLRMYPGIRVCYVAPFDWYFEAFLFPTLRDVLEDDDPLIEKILVKERRYQMRNGSECWFHAFDEASKVKGFQCHRFYIEECSVLGDGSNEKGAAIFSALVQRMRAPGRQYDAARGGVLVQNPGGHNWTWKKFVKDEPNKPQRYGDVGLVTNVEPDDMFEEGFEYGEYEKRYENGDIYYTVRSESKANIHNPGDYVGTMLADLSDEPAVISRMVKGSFAPIHSLVYGPGFFSEATHVVDTERVLDYWNVERTSAENVLDDIPRHWRLLVGIDPAGSASPWAIQFVVETPEDYLGLTHYINIGEIYMRSSSWDDMADRILDWTDSWNIVSYYGDPFYTPQKHGPDAKSIKDEFTARGIPVELPPHYNKEAGIRRVQEMLKRDHRYPSPYRDDAQIEEEGEEGYGLYEVGRARLFYAGTWSDDENGVMRLKAYAKYNLKEKEVYRRDSPKTRPPRESEEGLSTAQDMRVLDRDDHAQTAEMFLFLGVDPPPPPRSKSTRKAFDPDKPRRELLLHGHGRRRGGY